jgi:non-heme chloroperoxidase
MALQCSLTATVDCNRTANETDFRAEMPGVEVPTLIIHGDVDQSVPIELTGRRSARLIPDSRLIVYERGPHGLMLTHMDRLNRDLLAFVRA